MKKWALSIISLTVIAALLIAWFGFGRGRNDYHFIVIADPHLGMMHKMDLTPDGSHVGNDLDEQTFKMLLNSIHQLILNQTVNPSAIFILGDLVDHVDENVLLGSYQNRKNWLQKSFSDLLNALSPIPLIYVFGNNDSLSGDSWSFDTPFRAIRTPWQIAKDTGWKSGFLSTDAQCSSIHLKYPCVMADSPDQKSGIYTLKLKRDLRLISLNTVMFSRGDYSTYHGDHYDGELNWFREQMQRARDAGDTVLIAMHVAPGIDMRSKTLFWEDAALKEFLQDVKLDADRVAGILVAHTHMEELRLISFSAQTAIPVIFTAGLSTSHGNASSFKYFTLHWDASGHRWNLQDYQTFYYSGNQFKKLYDFSAVFCPGQKMASIGKCMLSYLQQGKLGQLLDLINKYYTAGNPNNRVIMKDKNPRDLLVTG